MSQCLDGLIEIKGQDQYSMNKKKEIILKRPNIYSTNNKISILNNKVSYKEKI